MYVYSRIFGNAGVYNYMYVYVSNTVVVGGTMYNHVHVCTCMRYVYVINTVCQ